MKWLIMGLILSLIIVGWQAAIIMELQDRLDAYRDQTKTATVTTLEAIEKTINAKVALDKCQGRRLRLVKSHENIH